MKKVLIASGVALLAFTMIAGAQGYTFSNNLTVGSTGPDVVALQTWLVANGYSIPAVQSGAAAKGYFGSQTKTAVAAYQVAAGIVNPGTGFFGPLTRAKLNAGGSSAIGSSCPTGYTCTANSAPVVQCPVGYTCTANTGTGTVTGGATGITTLGVPGSLDLSNGSYVGNGTAVNDGQEVDLGSVALQTGASDMAISSASVDFNVRPWLYMSSISIRDTSGNTLATVSNLNQGMFSEITVGSDYRLTIPLNLVLPKTTRTIAVLHGVFATSNRAAASVAITELQVRSTDGTGVTLTSTLGPVAATVMYVAYGGQQGSSLLVSIDGSSPLTGNVQTSSGNTQTQNVLMGVYKIKSQNVNATLQGLSINAQIYGPSSTIANIGSALSAFQLKSGSTLLTSGTVASPTASTSVVTFSNFNLALPANTYVPVSVYVTVAGAVNNLAASTSLVAIAANITGIDASSNALTVSTTGTIASSNQTFTLNGVNVTNLAVGTPNLSGGSTGGTLGFTQDFIYTLNAGNTDLYVSKTPYLALATSTMTVATSSTLTGTVRATGTNTGDNTTDWIVPSGTSRTFTVTLSVSNMNGTPGVTAQTHATAIYYSTATPVTAANASSITYNLDALTSASIQLTVGH
jgi:peptidoglycan hydrolase-like protein with peptidoglycan-binding domain